jgi:hypothetical protein
MTTVVHMHLVAPHAAAVSEDDDSLLIDMSLKKSQSHEKECTGTFVEFPSCEEAMMIRITAPGVVGRKMISHGLEELSC